MCRVARTIPTGAGLQLKPVTLSPNKQLFPSSSDGHFDNVCKKTLENKQNTTLQLPVILSASKRNPHEEEKHSTEQKPCASPVRNVNHGARMSVQKMSPDSFSATEDETDDCESSDSFTPRPMMSYTPPSTPQARAPGSPAPSNRRQMVSLQQMPQLESLRQKLSLLSPDQCVDMFNEDTSRSLAPEGIASPDSRMRGEYRMNNFFGASCGSSLDSFVCCPPSPSSSSEGSPMSASTSSSRASYSSEEDVSGGCDYSSYRSVVTSLSTSGRVASRRSKFSQRVGLPPLHKQSSVSYDDGELVCEFI